MSSDATLDEDATQERLRSLRAQWPDDLEQEAVGCVKSALRLLRWVSVRLEEANGPDCGDVDIELLDRLPRKLTETRVLLKCALDSLAMARAAKEDGRAWPAPAAGADA